MKKTVITYGTFDMLHIGHINLLKRAKDYGNYLIVGVTSEDYDRSRGKLNVVEDVNERVKKIKDLEFVDEVIIEYHKNQKSEDIKKYNVDKFVIGDDWLGSFDYLKPLCEVIYLPRTKGISSTLLREKINTQIKIGVVGAGRIVKRFLKESEFIEDIIIRSIVSRSLENAKKVAKEFEIHFCFDNIDQFLNSDIEAVYIASPHEFHYSQIKKALNAGKHVLCEKPITLKSEELEELFLLAAEKKLILLEAIKTAFFPAFNKLLYELNNQIIGEIKEVRATFTKLVEDYNLREKQFPYGGSTNELSSYPLLLATKILGKPKNTIFLDQIENKIDLSNRIICEHENNTYSISTVGIGVKSEGSAVISGTKGYIYIPAPWWLSKDFFIRYEDSNQEHSFHYNFEGDGLRYEISEFISLIKRGKLESDRLKKEDMININSIISKYNEGKF